MLVQLLSTALAGPVLSIPTDAGPVEVHSAYHGSLHLSIPRAGTEPLDVWVDPWSKDPALPEEGRADLVLITDVHFDHLDPEAFAKVAREGTTVVAPQAVADEKKVEIQHIVANGKSVEVGGIPIEAVPMYNLERGPEPGKLFHDKGRGNGYILNVGKQRIYIAGDTECTPEMKALEGITHAFVPMNLPYTMPPEEAAACVAAFAPKAVTPVHYAGSDLSVFEKQLADKGVKVQTIDAYPGGLPW